jgi:ligand-binding sensor domain-containing protein
VHGDILRVESGKTVRGIDFRFPQFKKGTWRHYDTSDGLASMMVNDIHQASDGTMWFGTRYAGWPIGNTVVGSGVSRYDGQEFVTFTTEDGLASNAVTSIYCDQDGVMWFGTWGGVSRYDGKEFVNFTTKDGLANNLVISVYCDQDGVMWFGTPGGVSRYDARGDSAASSSRGMGDFPHFVNFTAEDGLLSKVVAIYGTPDGILWFRTGGAGVSRYDARGDSPHFVNFTTEDGLADNRVSAICCDPDGAMWFGTWGGVSRYDGKEFVTFTTKDGLASNAVMSISCDQDGVM